MDWHAFTLRVVLALAFGSIVGDERQILSAWRVCVRMHLWLQAPAYLLQYLHYRMTPKDPLALQHRSFLVSVS